jgi:hypothetical protein
VPAGSFRPPTPLRDEPEARPARQQTPALAPDTVPQQPQPAADAAADVAEGRQQQADSAPSAPVAATPVRRAAPPRSAVVAGVMALAAGAAPASAVCTPNPAVVPFAREVYAPLPDGYVWPRFSFISLYDHRGAMREEWCGTACSVGDRPTDVEPSEDKYHYVMDALEFLAAYPHPIDVLQYSVPCTFTTYAQHAKWGDFVRDGSIFRTADTFLFLSFLGKCSAGEHPPSALDHVLAAPTFATTAFEHGDPADAQPVTEKTYVWRLRHLSPVPPSHPVPLRLQRPRASHPDREVQMLLRSAFSRPFAKAHVAVWQADAQALPPAARAPLQLDEGYATAYSWFLCRYAAFSSWYAPRVALDVVLLPQRPRLLVAVPIGWAGTAPAALLPLDAAAFAVPLREGVPLLQQLQIFRGVLPSDEHPQEMCITRDAHADIVFAMPCAFPVMSAVHTPDELEASPLSSLAAWATVGALAGRRLVHVALALQRCRSFIDAVPWYQARVGARSGPEPVVPHRAARAQRTAAALPQAAEVWTRFLADERRRKATILDEYSAVNTSDDLLMPFITNVVTAADVADELQFPPQGPLPPRADVVALVPYPEPPPPVHTDYLARMPPQQAPPGFPQSFAENEVLHGWACRLIHTAIGKEARHSFECFRQGASSVKREPFFALGAGAFRRWAPPSGGPPICLNQFILEQGADGRYRLLDFHKAFPDHKNLEAIMGIMGFSTNKQLMSFMISGMRWKAEAPREIRVSHGVISLDSRVRGVGDSLAKLADKGMLDARLVCLESDLDSSGGVAACAPPLPYLPCYVVGLGGQDKADKPDEKRPTGNTSDPHTEVRARNEPHGPPDGDMVVSFNDLTGPKKAPHGYSEPGYDGPTLPWPDPEVKHRPREVYAGNAYVCALAQINGTFPVVNRDDVRWMFFQHWLAPCEYWLCCHFVVVALCTFCRGFAVTCCCDDRKRAPCPRCSQPLARCQCDAAPEGPPFVVLACFRFVPRVMNMGTRPASKVATQWSKEWNVEFRARMADYAQAVWLPLQSQALRDVLAERERRLGYAQAHPFWVCEWTDDFWDVFPEVRLAAHGALVRRGMARDMNVWMSAKASCGTVGDYIGARSVLTGGFGTAVPRKRARCVADCAAACAGLLSKDDLIAHNSYVVHVVDILDLEQHLLNGLWAPVKFYSALPGFAVVDLTLGHWDAVRHRYQEIAVCVAERPCASFLSGVRDAPRPNAASLSPEQPTARATLRMSSDACASPERHAVFGNCLQYEWRIVLSDLDPEWSRRHITLGESIGAFVNIALFGLIFYAFELIQEGDNTTEGAMVLSRSAVPDIQYVSARMRETRGYQLAAPRLWFEHCAGLGLGFADAGSRNYDSVCYNLAAAFGRERVRVEPFDALPELRALLDDILEHTSEYVYPKGARVDPPPEIYQPAVGLMPSAADLRASEPEEYGAGLCPSAWSLSSASMLPRLSPTPPRRVSPRLSPAAEAGQRRLSPTPTRPAASFRQDLLEATRPGPARTLSPSPPPPECVGQVARRQRSPQPMNAAAARARAEREVADRLLDPANPYAFGPAAGPQAQQLVAETHAALLEGIPPNTLAQDNWGFNKVAQFCRAFDVPVMRPRPGDPCLDEQLEVDFTANALVWCAPRLAPGKHTAAAGATRGKPPSAMLAIYAYRRVQRDCGRYVCDLAKVRKVLKGLTRRFVKDFCVEALATHHHEPIPLAVVTRVVEVLRSPAERPCDDPAASAVDTAVCFAMSRAPRLDEVCEMFAGDTFYCRANFVWVRGGDVLGGTAAAGPLVDGDFLRVTNVPSKTDRSGVKWVGRYMWYRLDRSNPINFPAAWERYEAAYPCPVTERASWAAFSPDGTARPFRPAQFRVLFRDALAAAAGDDVADRHHYHDFRATIASALKGLGKDDATVQAAVCWASPESVALYGQMLPANMADLADMVAVTDAARSAHLPRPHVCNEDVARELEACVRVMGAASAPTAGAPAAGASKKKRKKRSGAAAVSAQGPEVQATDESPSKRAPTPAPLPPGWVERKRELESGRTYPVYVGPTGVLARSRREAWRVAESVPGVADRADTPRAAPPSCRLEPAKAPPRCVASRTTPLRPKARARVPRSGKLPTPSRATRASPRLARPAGDS